MKKTPMKSKIEVKKNEIVIAINTLFYPKENIMNVVDRFNEFFWAQIEAQKDNFISLSLKPKKDGIDLDTVGYEFMNHLLADVKDEIGE